MWALALHQQLLAWLQQALLLRLPLLLQRFASKATSSDVERTGIASGARNGIVPVATTDTRILPSMLVSRGFQR
jgi:hypothetical protein